MSTISPISSSNLYPQTQQVGGIRQDLQALQEALQSGNLSSAQSAFAKLQQDIQTSGQGQTGQQNTQTSLQNDLQALGKALQSGDLSAAQQAFATFQQDAQKGVQGHHHHHHHSQNTQETASSTNSSANDGTGTSTNVSVMV